MEMTESLPLIKFDNVSKSYLSADGTPKKVLHHFNLSLSGNTTVSIVGSNGVGKSTLLSLVARFIEPDEGTVEVNGNSEDAPRIGFVWQDYRASLFPWYTVKDNILVPSRFGNLGDSVSEECVADLLSTFLPDVDPRRFVHELSGGQQQLVSLIRSAVLKPDIFLLDEPFSALDQFRRWELLKHTEALCHRSNSLALFVSHDIDEAILAGDQIIVMDRKYETGFQLIRNSLPRPRTMEMLTSQEHIRCRNEVLSSLFESKDTSLKGRQS